MHERFDEKFYECMQAWKKQGYVYNLDKGIKSFIESETTLAYELGKKEMLEMVVKWCDKRCEENIRINGTDKWNSDLEDLKQKLLALNEE